MAFFKDFIEILSSLTFVDFVFFGSMMMLIVLVVILIYFIKINNSEIVDTSNVVVEEKPAISVKEITPSYDDENDVAIDLASITKALNERTKNPIEMTDYEMEQEERAIISYDELLERSKNLSLNYEVEEEKEDNEVTIKKVDLENLVSKVEDAETTLEVRVISYQKEEAFLEALKNLKEQIG